MVAAARSTHISDRVARQNRRGKQETRVSGPCHGGNTHTNDYRRRMHGGMSLTMCTLYVLLFCSEDVIVEHRHNAGAPLPIQNFYTRTLNSVQEDGHDV